jgi:hypothetical protein
MAQFNIGAIDPSTFDGNDLAEKLPLMEAAFNSGHIGAVRPSYAVAGLMWVQLVSSVESNLMYYNGVSDQLLLRVNPSARTVAGFGGLDLAAISQSKGITAVAGMVYNTAFDTDGGAWIDGGKARASSWYNEALNTATRGATRGFPAVAVILAETAKITIYDGTNPALPMWMVFNAVYSPPSNNALCDTGGAFRLAMKLGTMAACSASQYGQLLTVDFLSERIELYRNNNGPTNSTHGRYLGNVAERNAGKGTNNFSTVFTRNEYHNSVAITVFPDAPFNPATGLQTPTIVIGSGDAATSNSGGGVIFQNNGTSTNFDSVPVTTVGFTQENDVIYTGKISGGAPCIVSVIALNGTLLQKVATPQLATVPTLTSGAFNSINAVVQASPKLAYVGLNSQLTAMHFTAPWVNGATQQGMVAYLSSTYNTGWMVGDIKGAFLSSVSTTSLVEGANNQITSPNDISVAPWSSQGTITVHDADEFTFGAIFANRRVVLAGLEPSTAYLIEMDVQNISGNTALSVFHENSITGAVTAITIDSTLKTYKVVVASSASGTLNVGLQDRNSSGFGRVRLTNVSVTKVETDRSVNNKGLIINGTITRTAVATGAELVGYSGLSGTNYLEQPYNADLNFGTGDICIMGWTKPTNATWGGVPFITHAFDDTSGLTGWRLLSTASDVRIRVFTDGALVDYGITAAWNTSWKQWVVTRVGTTLSLHLDGRFVGSVTNANIGFNLTANTGRTLKIDGVSDFGGKSHALIRISATAPTAAQIAKTYNDEKHLFQANALAVLSADAVTALSRDPVTGLLYVGGASGMATVSGITPVSRDATAVTTFISVVDGMEVKR